MENNFFEKSMTLLLGSNARVVGYLTIILGSLNVLLVLSIISVISKAPIPSNVMTLVVLLLLALLGTAILQIISGIKAKTTGEGFRDFLFTNDKMIEQISVGYLKNYFTITKILYIVNISFFVLIIIFLKTGLFKEMLVINPF
ncbi:MAG: hypothetical protein LC102_08285 [Ignavibacteriales bacterium]|nr:MAG: hypothetical protein F9K26_09560 [Ignavibacteriaceae bacterium]MBW7872687.1 hypothetical protein [Ignavibacteria bacterium]MCZ2143408.1 hypothetical protein [Ignavibacteriales bacterium]OQY74080.1 MAG: hypothetical protein B6D45_07265 [Ignavibacteriales bacterium UTCHB3]MBV6444287.1 hypothetical protein [Ignavibacteriaceae bacterium]